VSCSKAVCWVQRARAIFGGQKTGRRTDAVIREPSQVDFAKSKTGILIRDRRRNTREQKRFKGNWNKNRKGNRSKTTVGARASVTFSCERSAQVEKKGRERAREDPLGLPRPCLRVIFSAARGKENRAAGKSSVDTDPGLSAATGTTGTSAARRALEQNVERRNSGFPFCVLPVKMF